MKTEFWLLDLNFEIYQGKPTIWLWGITRQNRRVLVIEAYEPYFYLVLGDHEIQRLKHQLETEKAHLSILRTEIEKKKDLGLEKQVLKVFCEGSEPLEKLAVAISKAVDGSRPCEHDLRPATKYQNDNEIRPCQWYEVEADSADVEPEAYSVDETLVATSHPSSKPNADPPELRTFGFSLLTVSQAGSPRPKQDPIRLIAWSRNDGKNGLLQATKDSDSEILEGFRQLILDYNPDIIFSFGGNTYYWPYLTRRAEKTQKPLDVGRGKVSPHQSLYGHFSITGRGNVDLEDFAQDLYDVKEKTLQNVANYLGLKSNISPIDETEYFSHWTNAKDRAKLVDNSKAEAETALELGNDALPYTIQLSSLSALPLDQVLKAAVGFRVDSYMMMEARKLGQLIPSRTEQPIVPYKGAIVLEPETGLYENVVALDFSSMYPSLMIKHNISPDTLVPNGSAEGTFTVPEVGHKFRNSPPGFYPIVLRKLIESRRSAKQEAARLQKGSTAYRLAKAKERATKIITNAVYGYAGWAGSRWYSREVAESAAALGRATITEAVSIAKDLKLRVFYGDTDSLFLEHDEVRVGKFLETIKNNMSLEINIGQVYKQILFPESKKKYAGLKENGELEVVGMEAIRGDWSGLAKAVQNRVLQMVLRDKGPSKAAAYVANLASDLKSANFPLSSFVIWKTLTKRPGDYAVHAPHVEAAKKLEKAGWPMGSGDRVGYVMTRGAGKLYERAQPYSKVSLEDVDYDYYVQNQVVPVAGRILTVFGTAEKDLLADKGAQAKL